MSGRASGGALRGRDRPGAGGSDVEAAGVATLGRCDGNAVLTENYAGITVDFEADGQGDDGADAAILVADLNVAVGQYPQIALVVELHGRHAQRAIIICVQPVEWLFDERFTVCVKNLFP